MFVCRRFAELIDLYQTEESVLCLCAVQSFVDQAGGLEVGGDHDLLEFWKCQSVDLEVGSGGGSGGTNTFEGMSKSSKSLIHRYLVNLGMKDNVGFFLITLKLFKDSLHP